MENMPIKVSKRPPGNRGESRCYAPQVVSSAHLFLQFYLRRLFGWIFCGNGFVNVVELLLPRKSPDINSLE